MIKTFPLHFTEEEHKQVKKAAKKEGMSIKAFIHMAIKEQMKG